MTKLQIPAESHRSAHIAWLRAAVLGANDGIVSTASLIIGVAAANSSQQNIMITGVAGLVAGAMSMAAGEYVSVSSQSDTEKADLVREQAELDSNIEFETEELANIYKKRGLDSNLAKQVAEQLMKHDALGSHAREELGFTEELMARPIQAAVFSAGAFSIGALMPLLMIFVSSDHNLIAIVSIASLFFLVFLGVVSAYIGGASIWKGALRVGFWGVSAMAITAGIGALFGTVI